MAGGTGKFLLGGIIGAALGVLFAPAPGAETRAKLKEKAQAYLDSADVINDNVRDKAVELYSTATGAAGGASDQLKEKIDLARARLTQTVNAAAEATNSAIAEASTAADAAVADAADAAEKSGKAVAEAEEAAAAPAPDAKA